MRRKLIFGAIISCFCLGIIYTISALLTELYPYPVDKDSDELGNFKKHINDIT